MQTTKLSSKGQVIIGTGDGILVKPETPFQETTLDEVTSCLKYHGKPKSLEDMEKAIIIRSKMEKGYP